MYHILDALNNNQPICVACGATSPGYGKTSFEVLNQETGSGQCICPDKKPFYGIVGRSEWIPPQPNGNSPNFECYECDLEGTVFDADRKRCLPLCSHGQIVAFGDDVCSCPDEMYMIQIGNTEEYKCGKCEGGESKFVPFDHVSSAVTKKPGKCPGAPCFSLPKCNAKAIENTGGMTAAKCEENNAKYQACRDCESKKELALSNVKEQKVTKTKTNYADCPGYPCFELMGDEDEIIRYKECHACYQEVRQTLETIPIHVSIL